MLVSPSEIALTRSDIEKPRQMGRVDLKSISGCRVCRCVTSVLCAPKMKCCLNTPVRYVLRDANECARDVARRLTRTKAVLRSRDERKCVEMGFAHLKVHHGFERMRLRGLSGVRDKFHLAAIVQNLKTLALRTIGLPAVLRPVPNASAAEGATETSPLRRPDQRTQQRVAKSFLRHRPTTDYR
jgi:hypothetical protein